MKDLKYIVKNITSGEESLCEKVVVDNQDYYVTGDDFHLKNLQNNDLAYHWKSKEILTVLEYTGITADWLCLDGTKRDSYKLKKVIATTKKYLDLPMVIDEVDYYSVIEQIATSTQPSNISELNIWHEIVMKMCSDAISVPKETYSYTKEDMVEFVEYLNIQYRDLEHTKALKEIGSVSESIDLWQEQRIKTILVK